MTRDGAQIMQIIILILLITVVTTPFLEETSFASINKYLEIKHTFPKLDSLLCVGNCTVKTALGQSQHLQGKTRMWSVKID